MPYALSAVLRTKLGKRSKDERLENRIPAVLYGHGTASQTISIPRADFVRVLRGAGYSSLIDMDVAKQSPVKVLIKEVQLDVLSTDPVHVDFYQVRMDEELTAKVPLKFVGESAAVKTDGGTLVKSMDEIEVECLPADLPHAIEVDLSTLATFDDVISVGNLTLPKGVKVVSDTRLTVATVARPLTEEELKAMEAPAATDVTAIKTEGEEKKAAEEAKKAEEAAAAGEAPAASKK